MSFFLINPYYLFSSTRKYVNGTLANSGTLGTSNNTAGTNSPNCTVGCPFTNSNSLNTYIYEVLLYINNII